MKTLKETLHHKAIEQLSSNIRNLLENCWLRYVEMTIITTDTGEETVLKMGKKMIFQTTLLEKTLEAVHKPGFLGLNDLYVFLNIEIQGFLEHMRIDPNEPETNLKDLLNAEMLDQFSMYLVNELISFPRAHEVIIPLMSVDLPKEIDEPLKCGPNISIFRMNDELRKVKYPFITMISESGNDDAYPPVTDYVYLAFTTYSYGYFAQDSSLYRDFSKRFKIFISALIVKQILILGTSKNPWEWDVPPFEDLWEHFYNETGTSCYYIYSPSQYGKPGYGRLPKMEWQLLRSLNVNQQVFQPSELEKYVIQSKKIKDKPENIRNRLLYLLKGIDHLFEDNCENAEDIERISTSLDWFFQALVNDNKTFSFVQMAIALEALLGEHKTKKDITELLANKCAYLIRKNPTARREVMSHILEIYDVRSKILHTGKPLLNKKTEKYYFLLKNYLQEVLASEIESL